MKATTGIAKTDYMDFRPLICAVPFLFFQLCFMILLLSDGFQLPLFEGHLIYCQALFPFSTSVTEAFCINRHVLNY